MGAKRVLEQNRTTEHVLEQNRTTEHKTDRVARHGLYKIMQYKTMNQGQEGKKPIKIDKTCRINKMGDGREKTGRRNPEVAPRLKRRKRHEKEQEVHENEEEEEVVKCKAFLCQEPKTQRQKWIGCDKCEWWLQDECGGIQRQPKGNYDCGIARIKRSQVLML